MINPQFKRTKILATIGPATNSATAIRQLAQSGANGFRLNFSHGDYEEREQQIAWIRKASSEVGKPVAIVQDLQGPKIRLGNFNDGEPIKVKTGQKLLLEYNGDFKDGDEPTIPVQYNLASKVKLGQIIYIFDGRVRAKVIDIASDKAIKIEIKNNGIIQARKGLNLPETDMAGDILTPKDLRDIKFGASQDIDYVALSFVQTAEDIQNLRQILKSYDSPAKIIAKIETKMAISAANLEGIVKASDAIMVARGDLAVEAGAEVVPVVQEKLMRLCRRYGKLVIVATQMLASMVDSPEPTRAEVSDVATAVRQGADVVMLSDETANGNYPQESLRAMKKVILYVQDHLPSYDYAGEDAVLREPDQVAGLISQAAVRLSNQIKAHAIVVETTSGATASMVASERPNRVILSVTDDVKVAQQLALSYANQSYVRPNDGMAGSNLINELKAAGRFGDKEQKVRAVIVSGRHPGVVGGSDTVQVRQI